MSIYSSLILFLLVLALAYAGTRLLGRRLMQRPGAQLHLKESLPLGRDRSLLLIEVGGKRLLVGVTQQSVNLVARLEGGEEP